MSTKIVPKSKADQKKMVDSGKRLARVKAKLRDVVKVGVSAEEVEKSHGQLIIKKIGELFSSAGFQMESLDGIVVCTGPGSFTGLRIGIATAKGKRDAGQRTGPAGRRYRPGTAGNR